MNKPCEYCGGFLPAGVDKRTRRIRSAHFARCTKRPSPVVRRPPSYNELVELLRGVVTSSDLGDPEAHYAEVGKTLVEEIREALARVNPD